MIVAAETSDRRVSASDLSSFVANAARFVAMREEDIVRFVDGLVEAELRGVSTHGIVRVPPYIRSMAAGVINPRPVTKTLRELGATALLDGDNGLGIVVGQLAMDRAINLASTMGVGVVAVRNSNRTGMLAVHVIRAAAQDMVGYFTSNGPAIMPPFGGREARLGNSPFAYAIPTQSGEPVVLDLACSTVARGAIRLLADRGEPIPEGWALDDEGHPTRDAEAAMAGVVVPMAGYKGYGIAFVNEVLSGALPGARLAIDMPRAFLEKGSKMIDSWESGHLAVAFNVSCFGELSDFKNEVDRLVQVMKETPLAPGAEPILVPGERESIARAKSLSEGVPVSGRVIKELESFADEIGIDRL